MIVSHLTTYRDVRRETISVVPLSPPHLPLMVAREYLTVVSCASHETRVRTPSENALSRQSCSEGAPRILSHVSLPYRGVRLRQTPVPRAVRKGTGRSFLVRRGPEPLPRATQSRKPKPRRNEHVNKAAQFDPTGAAFLALLATLRKHPAYIYEGASLSKRRLPLAPHQQIRPPQSGESLQSENQNQTEKQKMSNRQSFARRDARRSEGEKNAAAEREAALTRRK